jgi:hydroxypyruvate reductase
VDAGACVAGAHPAWAPLVAAAPRWHVIAVGKAAAPMLRACLAGAPAPPATALLVAPAAGSSLPATVEQLIGGHPVPTDGSVAAGERALEIARGAGHDDLLLVLLSGGASALMAAPVAGVTLAGKRATTALLLREGADIHELNTVRKHLSRVKGGRLAAAGAARTLCLAISDVIDDDVSVIGSGPTVGDLSTCADALAVVDRRGGRGAFPEAVVAWLERGAASKEPPTAGWPALRRADTRVIANRSRALAGARVEAARRGYDVVVETDPVAGEARVAAVEYACRLRAHAAVRSCACCVLSGGETTVRVTGGGRGGRNQEFALALAGPLAAMTRPTVMVSLGTDGVDGPTDAAGAIADVTTIARAAQLGGPGLQAFLDANDAYTFFDPLGDLIRTGPTSTNVGDLQVAVVAAEDAR